MRISTDPITVWKRPEPSCLPPCVKENFHVTPKPSLKLKRHLSVL